MIEIRPARGWGDYAFMRRVRNDVREWMTGDTRYISRWRQLLFWLFPPPGVACYVALEDGRRVGYMLLTSQNYITEAVAPEHRGRGVALAMIRHAQGLLPCVFARIRADNEPSLRLHRRAGFRRIGPFSAEYTGLAPMHDNITVWGWYRGRP